MLSPASRRAEKYPRNQVLHALPDVAVVVLQGRSWLLFPFQKRITRGHWRAIASRPQRAA
eukprot:5548322-Pyramimonas_sp.AAC.1